MNAMRSFWLRLAFALATLLLVAPAWAVTSTRTPVTNTAWVDLGAGPMQLSATRAAVYAISDLSPSLRPALDGFRLLPGDTREVQTTSHIWASAADVNGAAVLSAPITASGGGGGGGAITGPLGHATADNASVAVVPSATASFPVTGTFWQTTQPVSAASLPLPSGAATSVLQNTINTTLGSPFQAGGAIGNSSFGISGTLPAFAATPTFNVGTSLLAVESGGNLATIAANSGNPIPAQGSHGTNIGATEGQAAAGSAIGAQYPLPTGVSDGINVRWLAGDTSGDVKVLLVAGSALAGAVNLDVAGSALTATSNALDINMKSCTSGVCAPQVANNADAVATTTTNVPTATYGYGFNGTAWDRLQVDASKNLKVVLASSGATGSAVPTNAVQMGATSAGNLVGVIQGDTTTPISISSATTTELVAAVTAKRVLVTHYNFMSNGTGTVQFEYGTKTTTACDTGATTLSGTYNVTAQQGVSAGGGLGPVIVVPAGKELCLVTGSSATAQGLLTSTQEP